MNRPELEMSFAKALLWTLETQAKELRRKDKVLRIIEGKPREVVTTNGNNGTIIRRESEDGFSGIAGVGKDCLNTGKWEEREVRLRLQLTWNKKLTCVWRPVEPIRGTGLLLIRHYPWTRPQ